jgi:hypothetical protein
MAPVEIERIACLKRLHHLGQFPLGRLKQYVHMVGHQAVGQKIDFLVLAIRRQLFDIPLTVLIITENRLTIIPPANDVVDRPWIFYA